jgi:hypothetical protein
VHVFRSLKLCLIFYLKLKTTRKYIQLYVNNSYVVLDLILKKLKFTATPSTVSEHSDRAVVIVGERNCVKILYSCVTPPLPN